MDRYSYFKHFWNSSWHFIFSSILIINSIPISAQICPPGSITFLRQGQIDSFPKNYPGCTEISGSINIGEFGDSTDILNLDSLIQLNTIGGGLYIFNNPGLSSLRGLDSITYIDYWLDLRSNATLGSLMGLASLSYIGGGITIDNNSALENLEGLNNITSLGGGLGIGFNDGLDNLSGLENLTSIGGNLDFIANESLKSLSGLNNLDTIYGDLWIWTNDSLVNLQGLNSVRAIQGTLDIDGNDLLTSLTGLDQLAIISGDLRILDNPLLTSLSALQNVEDIGGWFLVIMNNDVLSTCAIKSICNYLDHPGFVTISNNAVGCNNVAEIQDACPAPSVCLVTNYDNGGPGSFREGINCTDSGDTLYFDPSLSIGTVYLNSAISIDKEITICASEDQLIWIDGTEIDTTLRIMHNAKVELINLIIQGSNGPHGVVWNEGDLTLKNVDIIGDETSGAVFSTDGILSFENGSSILIWE